MRLNKICLSLGLVLAIGAPDALAADWNRGGGSIKDRGGVPIPAPIPVADTFKWYLRADVGGGLITGGDPTSTGDIYGFDRDPAEGPAFGMLSSWFNNGFDTFATGGVGVGAYLSPSFRADVTVDVRTKSNVDADGRYSYTGDPAIYDNPLGSGYDARIDGTTRQLTEVRGTVGLANIYWDLAERGSRFVPYIGVGLGFVVRTIDVRHSTTEVLYNDSSSPVTEVNRTYFTGKSKAHQLAPAAAAMAGFGYTLDSGMVLDFNYRYTYLGEAETSTAIAYTASIGGIENARSKLTIGDTHEHALRAGVRWNVW